MTRLALFLLLTAACYGDTAMVQHFTIGLAPGRYLIATCNGDTLGPVTAGVAGQFSFATYGCEYPVRIWRDER